jgi:hypothetical protein
MPDSRSRMVASILTVTIAVSLASTWVYRNLAGGTNGVAVIPKAQPVELARNVEYDDRKFRELLGRYTVDDGNGVDYAAWQASAGDMRALDDYMEMIGRISPTSRPELFASRDGARRYWINAYNAAVIDAVLDHWPLDSVRDVNDSLTSRIIPGKGFFYDREIVVGGERTNLLELEKYVLERIADPRLHFALNCASESCPILRSWNWSERDLDQAARDFINQRENVEVRDRRLLLSRIFKWYRKDFPRDIVGYLKAYADPELQTQLDDVVDNGYPIRYRDYDWSLNGAGQD